MQDRTDQPSIIRVCGIDEAGRGPLAGPVVAGAVVFPEGYSNPKIKDSKQLSAHARDKLASEIKLAASAWAVVAVGHRRIDKLNIREATRLAMRLALERIGAVELVLIDGNVPIETSIEQQTVVKGDQLHVQISAASILAKTYRDHLMAILERRFPEYGFAQHAGYPTESHRAAIIRYGPSPVHRRTFGGVREHVARMRAWPGVAVASIADSQVA